jgi:hypothetical protein
MPAPEQKISDYQKLTFIVSHQWNLTIKRRGKQLFAYIAAHFTRTQALARKNIYKPRIARHLSPS